MVTVALVLLALLLFSFVVGRCIALGDVGPVPQPQRGSNVISMQERARR